MHPHAQETQPLAGTPESPAKTLFDSGFRKERKGSMPVGHFAS